MIQQPILEFDLVHHLNDALGCLSNQLSDIIFRKLGTYAKF